MLCSIVIRHNQASHTQRYFYTINYYSAAYIYCTSSPGLSINIVIIRLFLVHAISDYMRHNHFLPSDCVFLRWTRFTRLVCAFSPHS